MQLRLEVELLGATAGDVDPDLGHRLDGLVELRDELVDQSGDLVADLTDRAGRRIGTDYETGTSTDARAVIRGHWRYARSRRAPRQALRDRDPGRDTPGKSSSAASPRRSQTAHWHTIRRNLLFARARVLKSDSSDEQPFRLPRDLNELQGLAPLRSLRSDQAFRAASTEARSE
jgi:hypothetical protein